MSADSPPAHFGPDTAPNPTPDSGASVVPPSMWSDNPRPDEWRSSVLMALLLGVMALAAGVGVGMLHAMGAM